MLRILFRKDEKRQFRSPVSIVGFLFVALAAVLVGSVSGQARAADAVPNATVLDHPRVVYLSHCGGCHGIEGYSGNTFVPTLRNAVGAFACTDEGRQYLIRVPGVSMSLIRDDQELADVMNFVMLQLAGTSLPKDFHPYTAAEIHEWRQHPMSVPDFMAQRGHVLERALSACARVTDK